MTNHPRTWADVPGAVRAALERPFVKDAEGMPVLREAADVLGWRADGPVNSVWGGPRPLTNLLIGSALGSLGGYGVGRLAEAVLPESYFTPGAVRRRGAIIGGLLGAAPAAWQTFDNLRNSDWDPASVVQRWPLTPAVTKQSAAGDLFDPVIDRDRFNAAVMADPTTPFRVRAATAGLIEAASAVRGPVGGLVSPWDVAKIAVGAGAGLVSGIIAGKTLGLLAGLSPEGQNKVQQMGLWAGALNSVVPSALGLK